MHMWFCATALREEERIVNKILSSAKTLLIENKLCYHTLFSQNSYCPTRNLITGPFDAGERIEPRPSHYE